MPNLTDLPSYTVAELFCGCGGFSHGFFRTGRFQVVLGNDLKKPALRTFAFNHKTATGSPAIIEGDIRAITAGFIAKTFFSAGVAEGELDCLIGGPPCQGFSQLRRSEERNGNEITGFGGYNRLNKDPRNDLVLRFLEIANHIHPKIIVIENVPQMLRHGHNGRLGGLAEDVQELLDNMGYSVCCKIVNAADYGVPQLRERVFFIASRVGSVTFPKVTHGDPAQLPSSNSHQPWITVEDAIKDLPPPSLERNDPIGGKSLDYYPPCEVSPFASAMRSSKHFPYNHITRAYHPRIINIINKMRPGETWDHASARLRSHYEALLNREICAGKTRKAALKDLTQKGLINPVFYKSYYWSAYTRLAWGEPALTITANANFLGSGRFTHPEENRGITMREAARLQSFEDDFKFITSPDSKETNNIGVGLDMIGEAVPPLLSQAFAQQIAYHLDDASAPKSEVTTATPNKSLEFAGYRSADYHHENENAKSQDHSKARLR
ncbi:MAG TPA: DNA cytosine methyltransferase [Thermoanaerobaculia bacterium]|jgi:DNA (cytosine-5)-methyltransferase 1|nr:DNA cytosine methyltransferase [Thermoanaerobaculia bacterium]